MEDLRHFFDFRGPIMGSLKSACTTSYRSSIETIPLNCLVLRKSLFYNLATDRQTNSQTDRQTNRLTRQSHEAALAVASGRLIIHNIQSMFNQLKQTLINKTVSFYTERSQY